MTTELRGTTPVSPSNQGLAREIGNTSNPLEGVPAMGECFQAMLERQGSSHEEEALDDATGNSLPANPHIRTLVLAPRIKIKTIAGAAPDLDTLLAFARAQGMSDAAIALIARPSEATYSSSLETSAEQGGTDALPTGVSVIPAQAENRGMAFSEVSNALQASAAGLSTRSGRAAISADTHAGTLPGSPIVKGAFATGAGTETVTAKALDIIRTPRFAPAATRLPNQELRFAGDGIGAIVAAGPPPGSTAGSNKLGMTRDGIAGSMRHGEMSSSSAAGTEVMDPAGGQGANPISQNLAAGLARNPGQEMFRMGNVREAIAMASTGSPGLPAADINAAALVTGFEATLEHQAALADATGSTSQVRVGPVDDTRDASGSRATLDDVAGSDDARPSSAGSAWPSPPESPESKSAGATRAPDTYSQDTLRTLDNYRQLSLRMAEAVGQRILGMLNRGEWQLALQVNPAHLGRVDIRLTLRGNRMVDAEFLSSKSDTARLLASGESQLRACLDGAGFNTGQISSSFDSSLDAASRQARHASQPSGDAAGLIPAAPPAPVPVAQSERRPSSILTPERLDIFV